MRRHSVRATVLAIALVLAIVVCLAAPFGVGASASPTPSVPLTTTRLLFSFVTNQSGFNTGIVIANTSQDPFGTTPQNGTCMLNYYGVVAGEGTPPAAFATPNIPAGQIYANTLFMLAPNFQGYIIAVCNFALAHGYAFVSDMNAQRLAANAPVLVLPPTRSTLFDEQLGQ